MTLPQTQTHTQTQTHLQEKIEYAKLLAASSMIPPAFQKSPANILVAILLAEKHGFSPLMVMNEIYIVHNRPALSGKFVLALLQKSKELEEIDFEITDQDPKEGLKCRMTGTKLSASSSSRQKVDGPWVSMRMAKAEGWLSRPGSKWLTIPELMLRYRAAAWFARIHAPDILLGFQVEDEEQQQQQQQIQQQQIQQKTLSERLREAPQEETQDHDAE